MLQRAPSADAEVFASRLDAKRRRPDDAILTIVYHGQSETPLKFDDSDRDAGDIMIYGLKPPEEEDARKFPTTSGPTATSCG